MRRLATLLVLAMLGLGAGEAAATRGRAPAKSGRMAPVAKRMAKMMSQRPKGANKERPRNHTSKARQRGLQRAVSRRDTGLDGSEAKRARAQVARGIGDGDGRPKNTLKRSLKVALQKRGRQ